MNKKGFTLIELAISISLLSVIMIFLIKMLNIFEDNKDKERKIIDIQTNQAIISRYINNDVIDNKGISSYNCESKSKCTIRFNNDKEKTIELTSINGKTNEILKYYDDTYSYLIKKIPDGYAYKSITADEVTYNTKTVELINIGVSSNPEYDIQIISYN